MKEALRFFLRSDRGSAAIEFAVFALPMFMVLIGTIEAGRFLGIKHNLEHAADTAQRIYNMGNFNPKMLDSVVLARLKPAIENRFIVGKPERLTVAVNTKFEQGARVRVLELKYNQPFTFPGISHVVSEVKITRGLPVQF